MILTVRNRRDTTETIDFTDSRTSDFVVVRANTDTVVWQLSKESAAPSPTPTTLEFAPNETQTFTTTWDQTESDSGDQVRTGTYEARGVLVFDGFDDHPLRASQLGSPLEQLHDQLIARWRSRCITSTSSGSTIQRTSPAPGSRANSCGPACSTRCWRRSCSTSRSIPRPSRRSARAGCAARSAAGAVRPTTKSSWCRTNRCSIRADAAGAFAGSTLTIRIEEPAPEMLFVRFTYDVCGLEEVRDEQEDTRALLGYRSLRHRAHPAGAPLRRAMARPLGVQLEHRDGKLREQRRNSQHAHHCAVRRSQPPGQ